MSHCDVTLPECISISICVRYICIPTPTCTSISISKCIRGCECISTSTCMCILLPISYIYKYMLHLNPIYLYLYLHVCDFPILSISKYFWISILISLLYLEIYILYLYWFCNTIIIICYRTLVNINIYIYTDCLNTDIATLSVTWVHFLQHMIDTDILWGWISAELLWIRKGHLLAPGVASDNVALFVIGSMGKLWYKWDNICIYRHIYIYIYLDR